MPNIPNYVEYERDSSHLRFVITFEGTFYYTIGRHATKTHEALVGHFRCDVDMILFKSYTLQ